MGVFKGKRKSNYFLTSRKKGRYNKVQKLENIPLSSCASSSPIAKKSRQSLLIFSTPIKTPKIFRHLLQIPELRSPETPKQGTSKRPLEYAKCHDSSTHEQDLDESFLSILPLDDEEELESDEVNSLIQILPSVLNELATVDKKETFINFFHLDHEKKIPLNNIAFDLFWML